MVASGNIFSPIHCLEKTLWHDLSDVILRSHSLLEAALLGENISEIWCCSERHIADPHHRAAETLLSYNLHQVLLRLQPWVLQEATFPLYWLQVKCQM